MNMEPPYDPRRQISTLESIHVDSGSWFISYSTGQSKRGIFVSEFVVLVEIRIWEDHTQQSKITVLDRKRVPSTVFVSITK